MKYTEIDQNRIIILQKTCNPGALHQTHPQTHRQTEIHTFFIWYPRVGREHNSPSGNNRACLAQIGFSANENLLLENDDFGSNERRFEAFLVGMRL